MKNRIVTIAIAMLLASSAFAILPFTNGANSSENIPTYAYLMVSPNPVGINQPVYLSMWIDKVPPTANGAYGDRWGNFTIKITLPNNSTATLGPFTSDATGGHAATYVPHELGNYTFVFSFPGQTVTGGPGYPADAALIADPHSIGDVYGPSISAVATLEVTLTPASTIPENPLPTGYWQNPVEAFNHNWYAISGNWLGDGAVQFANSGNYNYNGNYNPYTTAPLSAHVVWTKSEGPGGQLGGEFGGNESSIYFTGMQYQPKFAPIIINGVLYYTEYPGAATNPTGWQAVNLRTGQTVWTKDTTEVLLCGQICDYVSPNQYGGNAYLWATRTGPVLGTFGYFLPGTYLDMFDATTGKLVLSVANVTAIGTNIEGSDGSLLQYFVGTNPSTGSPTLNCWNSSLCIINQENLWLGPQWLPPQDATINYANGIEWSVPLPTSYQGTPFPTIPIVTTNYYGPAQLAISAVDTNNNVIVLSVSAAESLLWQTGWQVEAGYSMATGTQLWITNRTETPYTTLYFGPTANGVYTEYTKETMTWSGYSTITGQKLWGPTAPYSNSLGYFDEQSAVAAYGNFYAWTFGGQVYCYNMTTGVLNWRWSDGSAGENTPYGVNPLWIAGDYEGTVADGVFYIETGHNYGPPLFSGAQIYAINATTGQEIWQFLNFASTSCLPVVDGYMLSLNSYDNQIYCYGKGLTATTVSAEPGQNSNNQVLISGTVTDQSPGQTCLGIPEAGTPAIGDQYMSQWMEYLFEQSPKPTNTTGVPVALTETDPNNNTYTIGTTISNINGQYSYVFTPNVPGVYTITATFGGSNSYYSSSAQTAYLYEVPSSQAPTATPLTGLASNTTLEYGLVAMIIVIVIIGAVLAVLVTRKHP